MEPKKLDSFPSEDGHIESILIGFDKVKVSFQTWDSKKLVLLFYNVENIISSNSVYGDIGEFKIVAGSTELKKYIFYSSWSDQNNEYTKVLQIEAQKMEIFQTGTNAEINSALFDVGYDYIGDQKFPYC